MSRTSVRSMVQALLARQRRAFFRTPYELIVTGAVGDGGVAEPQGIGRQDCRRRSRIALTREDVDDDVGRMDALGQCLEAGRLPCGQTIGEHGCEDFDHLPGPVVGPGQLAPHPLQRRWQHPVLERRAVAQSARLASQNRNVMPRIVYGCAASIAAWMFRHDAPVLADHDALGVGVNVDGAADRAGAPEYLLLSNRTRHVFDTEAGSAWNPSKRPR